MTIYQSEARGGTTTVKVDPTRYDPKRTLRLNRLGRELRLTNQILSDDVDNVAIVDAGPAPAWTTLEGDLVSFAMAKMPFPESDLDIAVWLGTNAHELGHGLFSPRRNSPLMRRVLEADRSYMRGVAQLHNIAEDQRQERFLLGRFAPWRGYLVAALGHHLVADSDNAWLLMAGRTWLPEAVRNKARRSFVAARSETAAVEVTRLIGEYQHLVDPGEAQVEEAWAILLGLHDLFGSHVPPASCQVINGGEPDTDPDEGEDMPAAANEEANEADEGEQGDGESEGEQQDAGGDEAAGSESSGEAEGEADGEGEGDSQAEGDAKDEAEGGQGASGQATSDEDEPFNRAQARADLKDAAKKAINDDDDARRDLETVRDNLASGRAGDAAALDPSPGRYVEATDAARRLQRDVGEALLDLKNESEPGWVKRVDAGRLNVRRLAGGYHDADELFDRYEPGQMDAAEIEAVLLLDVSSSMNSQTMALAEATWAIRHAVDDIEGRITTITWDDGPHRILAAAEERPDERMFVPETISGTDPTSALAEAYRLISDSEARNRLVVILTDGAWNYGGVERAEQLIEAIAATGAVTVLAHLGASANIDAHRCQHAAGIGTPGGLAHLFRDVAAAQIGAWL